MEAPAIFSRILFLGLVFPTLAVPSSAAVIPVTGFEPMEKFAPRFGEPQEHDPFIDSESPHGIESEKSGDAANADPEGPATYDFEWTFRIRPDRPNLFLNLNIYTWHLNKGDESEETVNDWPLGLGLTYELRRRENYIWTVDGDMFFVDSNNDFAAALGSSLLWRTRLGDLGLRGGILYKNNFIEDWGVPLAPVLFPVAQWNFNRFALKVLYIPGIRKSTDEQIFFQILIPLGGPR